MGGRVGVRGGRVIPDSPEPSWSGVSHILVREWTPGVGNVRASPRFRSSVLREIGGYGAGGSGLGAGTLPVVPRTLGYRNNMSPSLP